MNLMSVLRLLSDRTAVLFLGIAVGAAMGYAFAGDIATVTGAAILPRAEVLSSGAAAAAAVSAPTSGEPLEYRHPFRQRVLALAASGGRIRVGVFGDSFGDGIWAALYHQLPSRDAFQVLKFSQQSTGFTRYGSLNLEKRLVEQLDGQPIDIAVISFGANDTQGVMHNGRYAALLSPGWKAEIAARVERYVGLLRAQGAVVYWVGLPVMRKPSFDADISGMNAFYAETMMRLGVPFIDTRPMSVDENGQYAAYLPDPESRALKLARANDGIHMSMGGYQRLTAGLALRIRQYVQGAKRQAVADGAERLAALAPPPVDAPREKAKAETGSRAPAEAADAADAAPREALVADNAPVVEAGAPTTPPTADTGDGD